MENEEIKKRIREIINTPASMLSNSDINFLLKVGLRVGVLKNGTCKRCWHDYAMQLWNALDVEQQDEQDTRAYVLRDGVDVFFGNIRVNAATLTDELARYLLENGFNRKYFKKCE